MTQPLRGQPGLQIRFLKAAQLDAAVNVLKGMPQLHVGSGYRVTREEILHVVSRFGGAEAPGVPHQQPAQVGRQFGLHLAPNES